MNGGFVMKKRERVHILYEDLPEEQLDDYKREYIKKKKLEIKALEKEKRTKRIIIALFIMFVLTVSYFTLKSEITKYLEENHFQSVAEAMNEEEIHALQKVFDYINIPIGAWFLLIPSKLLWLYLWIYVADQNEKEMAIRRYMQYRSVVKGKLKKAFIVIMAATTIEQLIIFLLSKYCI